MRTEVKPSEKTEKLSEYLKPRVEEVEKEEDKLIVELENPEKLSRIPGVESFTADGEEREGLGGKPIHREAFFEIDSREDAAKGFLATVDGYTLYVSTERDWDLRKLKEYNSEIIETDREVAEELGVEELDGEFKVSRDELLAIYDEFLTD
jgi:hypothetical protein